MIELMISALSIWLFIKAIGLALKITWSTAKIIATILMALALPIFIVCLIFAGGLVLLIPFAFISTAFGLIKSIS